jgi:phosphotriesterase-related protein
MAKSSEISRRGLLAAPLLLSGCKAPGSILVHEHILVDFAGAAIASPSRYDREEVIKLARPRLDAIVALGCKRMLECTPNFLGRDPILLAKLSTLCKIELWTNTGLYAANNYKHLPPYVETETPRQLATRWIAEWRNGIDGTKPRFIKIGVNNGPLGPLDRKLVEAAAIASLETGLTIASHTGRQAAPEQVEILTKLRFPLQKFVWVHAQNERNHAIHQQVAEAGAWVEFDGVNARSAAFHKECVEFMASKNLLGRTLLSQDTGWYRVGEPGGGQFNGYDYIYREFIPTLNPAWLKQLFWDNPRAAFGK